MAQLPEVFKADEVEDTGFQSIPAAWYVAQINKSELKDTKAGTGKYLALTFQILEGDFAKRNIFANLNLVNPNNTAEAIAKRELKAICDSLELKSIIDSQELHGKPMQIKVTVKAATAQWPERNEIKAYKNIDAEVEDGGEENPFA